MFKGNLFLKVYTTYPKPDRDYIDGAGGRWIHISAQQSTKAKKIIKDYQRKIVSSSGFGTSHYLINGNVVKTNHAVNSTSDEGWCFKLYSETEKGLENIAGKLDLPLKFN